MVKQSNKAVGVAVAVGGVAALGVAAYALSQSKGNGQKEASQMLNGGYGGGATGGYSDAFTGSPTISDTISDVLSGVMQSPQGQQTPIIISPSPDDALPYITPEDNPQDELADIRQGEYSPELAKFVFQNYTGNELLSALNSIGFTTTKTESGRSNAASILIESLNETTSPQANTGVEYSPFNFAPQSKQADYSSYNAGKTGGSAANTPKSDNTNTGKTSDNKTPSPKVSSTSGGTKGMTITSTPSTLGSAVISAVGRGVSTAASTIGSFVSGIFGGK